MKDLGPQSEKQRTERSYYNSLVHEKWDTKSLHVDYDHPPFADYSRDLWQAALRYFGSFAGKKILEIGCGNGELSVWLAKHGANVYGIDISDESIRIAERRAQENGVATTARFHAGAGEETGFADNTFDIVFIAVSLHHLVVEDALKEIQRILKPDGRFIAIEPFVFSNTVQKVRESKVVQKIYPERRETPTERILYNSDLALIRERFRDLQYIPYRVFSPFVFKIKPLFNFLSNTVQRRTSDPETRRQKMNFSVQQLDERLLRAAPFMRSFSRYIVFAARPKK